MKKIPLGSGKYALVDDVDYDWLNQYIWKADSNGYVVNAISRSLLCDIPCSPEHFMHRLILGLKFGDPREVDHINHIVHDNRRCNIRICTHAQNAHNRKIKEGGSSKYKGVYWHKQDKKWEAHISIDGKVKYLGQSDSEKRAAQMYNLAAKKYFGKFALLNKIG